VLIHAQNRKNPRRGTIPCLTDYIIRELRSLKPRQPAPKSVVNLRSINERQKSFCQTLSTELYPRCKLAKPALVAIGSSVVSTE
jgi:hypothetical protein